MPAAEAPEPEPSGDDLPASTTTEQALVLTPALRVHDGGREAEGPQDPEPADTAPETQPAPVAQDAVLDAVADALVDAALQPGEDTDSARDAAPEENRQAADDGSDHGSDHGAAAHAGEAPVAEVDSLPDAAVQADAEPALLDPEDPCEPEAAEAELFASTSDAPDEGHAQGTGETLEAKIAALETLIGKRNEDWEPEEGDASPAEQAGAQMAGPEPQDADDALDWEDHVAAPEDGAPGSDAHDADATWDAQAAADAMETPPTDEPAQPDHDTGDADLSDTLLGEEPEGMLIDEETLRDMVCDIVREELQGALGERITRNVRRLVRREIHRALASQELD